MRIAFFSEVFAPQVNGVVVTLGKVTEYLQAAGHEILFVAPRNAHNVRPLGGSEIVELNCVPFPLYPEMPIVLPHWSFHRRSLERLEAFRPDLVHIWTPGVMAFFGQKWARQHHCPVAASYETDLAAYLHYYGFGRFEPQLWGYLKWLYNNCQRTYVPSEVTRRVVEAAGICNVRVFDRGVDSNLFRPSRRSASLRKTLGIEADEILILYVGRLSHEKNLPLLFRSAERLIRDNPKVRLIVTGTGPLRRRLTRIFARREIIFTGVRQGEDLAALFASADIFALPSSTETLSLASMEAMASGTAVLAMNAGGVRDILTHRKNSLLANSEAEFEAFLRQLAGDPALRSELGCNGRRGAERKTWRNAVEALERDYEILAAAGERVAR